VEVGAVHPVQKAGALRGTGVAPSAVAPHVCRDAPSSPRDLGAQVPDSGVDLAISDIPSWGY